MWVCANFQEKQTAFTFSAQIFPKMDLGLAVQKAVNNQHPQYTMCANF